jgi:putative lipoprotein
MKAAVLLALMAATMNACVSNNVPADGMENTKSIRGTVYYRERMMLPPNSEIRVTLEDISRMDVPSEMMAESRFVARGGPPYGFELNYDPAKIKERRRYGLRARIEVDGRLMFISDQVTPAFHRDLATPIEIRVVRVETSKDNESARKADASLVNTYWKLIHFDGARAPLGAGEREVHVVFRSEDNGIHGFSGCNRFTGTFRQDGDRLEFGSIAATQMACAEAMELERRFLDELSSARFFRISGDSLTLFGVEGVALLDFHAIYLQ